MSDIRGWGGSLFYDVLFIVLIFELVINDIENFVRDVNYGDISDVLCILKWICKLGIIIGNDWREGMGEWGYKMCVCVNRKRYEAHSTGILYQITFKKNNKNQSPMPKRINSKKIILSPHSYSIWKLWWEFRKCFFLELVDEYAFGDMGCIDLLKYNEWTCGILKMKMFSFFF